MDAADCNLNIVIRLQ